jgi:hypothetical protein
MNLYDLCKAIANRLGDTRSGVSTGGSNTTLTTSHIVEPNGYYNNGVLFINLSSPVMVTIDNWNSATQTFTFANIGVSVSSGTSFTASGPRFPLDVIQRGVWQAFHDVGYRMSVNETITTVADTLSYPIPTGCEDVRRVEVVDEDGNARRISHWRILENNLVFADEPTPDQTLRLHYVRAPIIPANPTDLIEPQIDFELLTVAACMHILLWRTYKVGRDEATTSEMLNYYMSKFLEMNHRRPKLMDREPVLARW